MFCSMKQYFLLLLLLSPGHMSNIDLSDTDSYLRYYPPFLRHDYSHYASGSSLPLSRDVNIFSRDVIPLECNVITPSRVTSSPLECNVITPLA